MIIIDTSVWVEALRDRASLEGREVDRLLREDEVALVGPVLAELLQGARSEHEFEGLCRLLAALTFVAETRESATRAGRLSYRLRAQGRAVGLVDLLIAALALEGGYQIYTLDEHFQRVPGLQLYTPESQ